MVICPYAEQMLIDAAEFPPGPDRAWRLIAAWKLDQMHRGVPARDWTDTPPVGFDRITERMAAE